jgi:cystathionine beta-lyase/cystathionine gamma-synthase
MGTSPGRFTAYFVVKTRATIQERVKSPSKSKKEIAEAEARQSQPKQVLHTASCHSPYIPEYVGNHPAASVASAS